MKKINHSVIKATGIVAATTAVASLSSFITTKFLMKMAMDRQEPKLMKRAEEHVSGSMKDTEIYKQLDTAAKKLAAAPTETVEIIAGDGTKLVGHWYPCDKPKRVIIGMHGWRSNWCKDFGLVADYMHEHNCSILFAEQRGQGSSGGEYIGFGLTERYDCLEWIDWVSDKFVVEMPIYLCGISMGATTVLMAAGLDLPDNVHGIIADCGFTSPEDIWRHVANHNLHISYQLHKALINLMCNEKIQMGANEYSTIDALKTNYTPILFVHGTEDHFVPVEMTYENYKACSGPKRLFIVPGADHGMSYLVDKEGYEKAASDFWRDFD